MIDRNVINNYCLKIILTSNYNLIKENIYLKDLILLDIINNDLVRNYIIENNLLNDYFIDKVINYHSNSKCVILTNEKVPNFLLVFSITKKSEKFFINFTNNLNRLLIGEKSLSIIDKEDCKIFKGVFNEVFRNNFFYNLVQYLLNNLGKKKIVFVGYSINGMSSIFLGYLTSLLFENKIYIIAYSIAKFCNQNLIDEIESSKKINLYIINHEFDPVQLLLNNYTLNFKNLYILNNGITIQNNKNMRQDDIIHNNFLSNMFSYSIKYHYSYNFFDSLLVSIK